MITAALTFPELVGEAAFKKDILNLEGWLPSPAAIVESATKALEQGVPEGVAEVLSSTGAPVVDCLITPHTTRAVALGTMTGRGFYHHELRGRLPMPPGLAPEVAAWEHGTVPVWSDGVLLEPKYFSFFQDAPLCAYNPNHRRKWRAHEMLHGAVGWFWHPEMTRFEVYCGSRIAELLPVVHWYAFDEIFRPRCRRHRGRLLYREHCRACEDLAAPYSPDNFDNRARRDGMRHAEQGLEHLISEWNACRRELETGRMQPTPRARLDASSDAVGYLRGHWNRVTAWSFGRWVELVCVSGRDYEQSLADMMTRSAAATRALLSGRIDVDLDVAAGRRDRSALQDLAYRLLLLIEHLPEGRPEAEVADDALTPVLDDIASEVHDPRGMTWPLVERALEVVGELQGHRGLWPEEVYRGFVAHGICWSSTALSQSANHAMSQVCDGVLSALPRSVEIFGREHVLGLLGSFIRSPTFVELGRLGNRFADWLAQEVAAHEDAALLQPIAERAAFEAWLGDDPRVDTESELMAVVPDGPLDGDHLRFHGTFRRREFSPNIVESVVGDLAPGSGLELGCVVVGGEARILHITPAIAQVLELVGSPGRIPADAREQLIALIENQIVVYGAPPPHR